MQEHWSLCAEWLPLDWNVCAYLNPAGIFLVCFTEGCLTEDTDSGSFPFTVRMASIRPILFPGLFCFVLLSWINRERLIHFFRKTGCTKILQVTMKQTCSRTIIFIKGPNNKHSRHLHGVAAFPPCFAHL